MSNIIWAVECKVDNDWKVVQTCSTRAQARTVKNGYLNSTRIRKYERSVDWDSLSKKMNRFIKKVILQQNRPGGIL